MEIFIADFDVKNITMNKIFEHLPRYLCFLNTERLSPAFE